jgi:fatty-acyl-CoA synthase
MRLFERIASEYAYLSGALRALAKLKKVINNPGRTISDVVADLAEVWGEKAALTSDRETLTYAQYDARATQYARWAMENGLLKGDVVALMMPNRPEYLAAWLGVARAGGVTALLNTNVAGPALAHCANIVKPKHVIVDADLADGFSTAMQHLEGSPRLWLHGGERDPFDALLPALAAQPAEPIPQSELPRLSIEDKCLFIYTSGTTGLPKAANINHYRVQSIMFGFNAAMRMTPADRVYDCLPLYHTSGGVLATGAALTAGATVFIREKFSATSFWRDIVRHDCSVFQYIGELCRYLLNTPADPNETNHRVRLACGNGLRPDIWEEFQRRFRIPKILEWYASTEGNAVFFNFDGRPGAVGRIPKWARRKFVTEIVRFDIASEQPVRGADGFCIKCKPGEIGEVISQILNDPKRPSQRFEGYADPAATQKKVLTDVFERGDRWFRTGDLMRKDEHGYFYFVDRIGDTFRWKGENVATSEVAETLSVFPGIKETNVYGVEVPGADGRAGMAAIVAEDGLDLDAFRRYMSDRLPTYARPIFLRLTPTIEATSTFKQRKLDLVREGFDPERIADPIYVFEAERGRYVPLDRPLYEGICSGSVRL